MTAQDNMAKLAAMVEAAESEHAQVNLRGEPIGRRHDPQYVIVEHCRACRAEDALIDLHYNGEAGHRNARNYIAAVEALAGYPSRCECKRAWDMYPPQGCKTCVQARAALDLAAKMEIKDN